MSKSTLTRRALVASTAAVPAAAALGLPIAQAAAEHDPAFALIERYKEASDIFEKAAAAENRALERFRDQYGRLKPDALSKVVREAFAEKFPENGLHKSRTSTHEQIEKWRAAFGDDEIIEFLHDELRHQTKVYEETVEPLELAKDNASAKFNDALKAIVQTPFPGCSVARGRSPTA